MDVCTKVDDLNWAPHPIAEGVKIKPLVTKRDHDLNVSCILVKVPVGIEIPEHLNQDGQDMLPILRGEKGELVMTRGKFNTIPISISQEPLTDADTRLYESNNHLQNFIDCIKSRRRCVADVEIGHRTATICHLCGIARRLGRTLRWDPGK